ncbi:hypothetical protein J6590_020556 [Homalodisca vitripennis]|nr:hypothetical protein J6590_020556 [Homalodisca vitripennis]
MMFRPPIAVTTNSFDDLPALVTSLPSSPGQVPRRLSVQRRQGVTIVDAHYRGKRYVWCQAACCQSHCSLPVAVFGQFKARSGRPTPVKVTENETEQDKDEIDKTGDTSEEENKKEENYCGKDEDNNGDDDFDEDDDDEEENSQDSQTERKGKNKEKKRKSTAREHEYKLTVFGTERDIYA